jgi:hypothetical protein
MPVAEQRKPCRVRNATPRDRLTALIRTGSWYATATVVVSRQRSSN